jgi:hypothetical protein
MGVEGPFAHSAMNGYPPGAAFCALSINGLIRPKWGVERLLSNSQSRRSP